jgi:hypothetical protein
MMQPTPRNRPLVLVLGLHAKPAARAAEFWRTQGAVVMPVSSADGCLRVATAVGPDIIVLDPAVSGRLVKLLAAHPVSARARIQWLPECDTPPLARAA